MPTSPAHADASARHAPPYDDDAQRPEDEAPDPVDTPPPSFTRKVLTTVGVVVLAIVLLMLLRVVSGVLLLAFAGVLLGVLIGGIAMLISAHTAVSYKPAVGVAIALLVVLIGGAMMWIGPQVAAQADEFVTSIQDGLDSVESWLEGTPLGSRLLANAPAPGEVMQSSMGRLTGMFSTVVGALANIFIIAFLGIYLALSPGLYRDNGVRLFPKRRRARAREVLFAVGSALRRWLAGRIASMAVVAILTTVGLLVLGVPLALTLGLLAFGLTFIPYIGSILAFIPALLIGFTVSPQTALYVALLYGGVQFVESYLITPLIQKRAVDLPPALLIFAQILMGALAGTLGVALATPLLVVAIVVVQMAYVEDVLHDEVTVIGSGDD